MSAILTSEHCVCISISSTAGTVGATHMVFHVPRPRIPRLEIHDSHLVDRGLKWYRDVHAQLPGRLDRHVLQDHVGKVVSLPRHPISGVKGSHKVTRMAGKGEESTGPAGISLRVVNYLSLVLSSAYVATAAAAGPNRRREWNILQKGL